MIKQISEAAGVVKTDILGKAKMVYDVQMTLAEISSEAKRLSSELPTHGSGLSYVDFEEKLSDTISKINSKVKSLGIDLQKVKLGARRDKDLYGG